MVEQKKGVIIGNLESGFARYTFSVPLKKSTISRIHMPLLKFVVDMTIIKVFQNAFTL